MTKKPFNGYANYETWAVALWLDNDEPLYREARRLVRRELKSFDPDTSRRSPEHIIADALEHWVCELSPDLGASMWADLLTHSLGGVDWTEIAGNYLSELREEMEREA